LKGVNGYVGAKPVTVALVLVDALVSGVTAWGPDVKVIDLACAGPVTGVLPGTLGRFVAAGGVVNGKAHVHARSQAVTEVCIGALVSRVSARHIELLVVGQATSGPVATVLFRALCCLLAARLVLGNEALVFARTVTVAEVAVDAIRSYVTARCLDSEVIGHAQSAAVACILGRALRGAVAAHRTLVSEQVLRTFTIDPVAEIRHVTNVYRCPALHLYRFG